MPKSFAEYLLARNYCIGNNDDFEPGWIYNYKGYIIGSDVPNHGANTIEILHDEEWYTLIADEFIEDWDYTIESVKHEAEYIIDKYEKYCAKTA